MRALHSSEICEINGGNWSSCYHSGDSIGQNGQVSPIYTCQNYTNGGNIIGSPYQSYVPYGDYGYYS